MNVQALTEKRQNGKYYTEGNPFTLKPFTQWAKRIGLKGTRVLEPFAGANNIIRALQQGGYADDFRSFDIDPQAKGVKRRDTLESFPKGFEVCITNPPWLAKNSAKRRGLAFPTTTHDDLYKYALEKCLEHCTYTAALIPATYLQSGIFLDELDTLIFLHDQGMFLDTDNPVCLALFGPASAEVKIYNDEEFVGTLSDLETFLPKPIKKETLIFNHPEGELGFIAIDGTRAPSIRFVDARELGDYPIVHTSRMITRIKTDLEIEKELIDSLNTRISEFRVQSKDVFLTPFKGLRKDGRYRRRMDYRLARHFINSHA